MLKIVTPIEMQEIDRKTIHDYGISQESLMDRAGKAVADAIKFSGVPSVYVFCGKGNNGGDGFVAARYLKSAGLDPKVFALGSVQNMKMDILIPYNKMIAAGVQPVFIQSTTELPSESPDIVIDALLGTGTKGELESLLHELVTKINEWKAEFGSKVYAVDIPSGLEGESGKALEAAVMADTTITMGLPKKGLIFGEGRNYTGSLRVADLGFPHELTRGGDVLMIESRDIRKLLKPRPHDSYKYSFGKVLIIAGSREMTGAAMLTAKSALRSGAGLVKLVVPESLASIFQTALPEVMTIGVIETPEGSIAWDALEKLQGMVEWCNVLAIGPGLSQHEQTIKLVQEICRKLDKPAVIDADGIYALAGEFELVADIPADVIFTPHAGEFAMLSGVEKEKLVQDRITSVRTHARRLHKTILLKGSPTIIASATGPALINVTGNPGMATAGSGDVLTGIIAGLMAQGLDSEKAGYAGAFLHGLAGDLAKIDKTEEGVIAGDLIDYLPAALKLTKTSGR